MDRNIRIPVDLQREDQALRVNIEQEFDNLEVLSLKISSSEAYARECSDFGVIVGRVILNNGFGVENAKVSIFVPIKEEDKTRNEILQLYPFETVNDTFPNGVRYNLLPRVRNNKNPSHRAVGNFPDPSDFAHYPQYVEIMDKYYKYTTTTNESGDYMIFGVPLGNHDIIMDFDVLDTKSFDLSANDLVDQQSLSKSIEELRALMNTQAEEETINQNKVPNFLYRGNNNYDVEVKTNLDDMPNIFHQVKQVTVSPFWGDDDLCDVGITRSDFKIDFKYTPTAIFFGFIHSPSGGFTINSDYTYNIKDRRAEIPAIDTSLGYQTGDLWPYQEMEIVVYRLDENLTPGTRTRLGVFKGSKYNGVFRISLPMYMDYYTTNEFGDLVPTNDTKIGIPTKGYYAFEFYDTQEGWNGRRSPWGGYGNPFLPGIRIPATFNGDGYLGGWEGTWSGLFEYDLSKRQRKFYTVKTVHTKHQFDNVLLQGNDVGYFPSLNPNKINVSYNFPISSEDVLTIDEPTIIGSVLVPRFLADGWTQGKFLRANRLLDEPWLDKNDTYQIPVEDHEYIMGLGVQRGGKNSGDVFETLFGAEDFITKQKDENGNDEYVNFFGDLETWNFGDNTKEAFTSTPYAISLASKKGSNANAFKVHKAYNQVVYPDQTFGVFVNCKDDDGKSPLMEITIYDITDELADLIKDGVYSSYRKGNIVSEPKVGGISAISTVETLLGQQGLQVGTVTSAGLLNTTELTIYPDNTYMGKHYYFGFWNGANALYDIEQNYYIK